MTKSETYCNQYYRYFTHIIKRFSSCKSHWQWVGLSWKMYRFDAEITRNKMGYIFLLFHFILLYTDNIVQNWFSSRYFFLFLVVIIFFSLLFSVVCFIIRYHLNRVIKFSSNFATNETTSFYVLKQWP